MRDGFYASMRRFGQGALHPRAGESLERHAVWRMTVSR